MHHRKAFLPLLTAVASPLHELCAAPCARPPPAGGDGQVHLGSGERGRTQGHHPGGGQRPPHGWEDDRLPLALTRTERAQDPEAPAARISVTLNSHVTLPATVLPRAV